MLVGILRKFPIFDKLTFYLCSDLNFELNKNDRSDFEMAFEELLIVERMTISLKLERNSS